MLAFLAALTATAQPAPLPPVPSTIGRTAWIFSTVDNSEWCPAGNVRIDVRTGRYELTSGASRLVCGDLTLERPVRSGTLSRDRLYRVRTAYLRALDNGLESQACREGRRDPNVVVVSNGGPHILIVATGAATLIPPGDRACWSDAARALDRLLYDEFSTPPRRRQGEAARQ